MFTISKFKGTQPEIDELFAFHAKESDEETFEHDWNRNVICIAKCDGEVAGYVAFSFTEKGLHINGILVGRKFRRMGLAKKFLKGLEKAAIKEGVSKLTSYVAMDDDGNIYGDALRSVGWKAFKHSKNAQGILWFKKELS
jgi:ribosomal protein S18 acetylase RimI-like enzyme